MQKELQLIGCFIPLCIQRMLYTFSPTEWPLICFRSEQKRKKSHSSRKGISRPQYRIMIWVTKKKKKREHVMKTSYFMHNFPILEVMFNVSILNRKWIERERKTILLMKLLPILFPNLSTKSNPFVITKQIDGYSGEQKDEYTHAVNKIWINFQWMHF